jgi:hypothetical protein
MKITVNASSPAELLDALRIVDIAAPGRTEGRKSWHCENWSICRFLSSFAVDRLLAYPLKLNGNGESPDFRLTLHDRTVGVETTQACHQDYSWASALAEKIPGAVLEPSLFKPGVAIPQGSGARPHIGSVNKPLIGPGWKGLEVEREWVAYLSAAIDQKTEALESAHFTRLDEDWLLIYDNTPGVKLHVKEAILMLTQSLESYWARESGFSSLLIEVKEIMIHITSTSSRFLPVTDVCLHGNDHEL